MSELGLIFTLSMGVLLLFLPRRYALLPISLITCYMTFGQRVVVAGLDFTMLRLLVLFGVARILFRNEFRRVQWRRLDTLIVYWSISSIIVYALLWQTFDAVINRLGYAYNAIGLYFIFRSLIRDRDDIKRACSLFALVLAPLAFFMCLEKSSGTNAFYMFGGVPQFTMVRQGTLRCQGPFAHPILAGTFGAVWLALFVGLWWQGKGNRLLATIGIISSTLITLMSGSSGPLATYIAGAIALFMKPMWKSMRKVRWAIVGMIVVLQMAMQEPVWFIFARANVLSGSTGWHRSHLIDQTITNFFDWWLIGIKDVNQWGIWSSHGHGDVTNQYIRHGVDGGLISMILFISIIVVAFSGLGRSIKAVKSENPSYHLLLWGVGSALVAHVVTFFSVAYFDQNVVNWYLLLAMIAAVSIRRQSAPQVASSIAAPLEPQTQQA